MVIDEINYSHQFEDLECELEEIPEYEPTAVEVPITLEPIETQTEPVFFDIEIAQMAADNVDQEDVIIPASALVVRIILFNYLLILIRVIKSIF